MWLAEVGEIQPGVLQGAIAAMTAKVAGIIAPAIDAIVKALIAADVAHFDATGFRVAGKLAWVHSASSGKFVLDRARQARQAGNGRGRGTAAFAGIACHDAWAPCDGYDGVAGHALCGAHLLRELTAVTGTGTADDVIWARQAIGALLELKQATGAARAAGHDRIDADVLAKHDRWFRVAADAGIVLNAARRSKLQKKRHALAKGCATAPATTCASPMTCGFPSTIIPMPGRSSA